MGDSADSGGTATRARSWIGIAALAVFLVSIPVMWFLGQLAVFAYGFGIWVVPWLVGAMLGSLLFPQGSYWFIVTEFDGPIIVFTFLAALQNALVFWLLVQWSLWASRHGRDAETDS